MSQSLLNQVNDFHACEEVTHLLGYDVAIPFKSGQWFPHHPTGWYLDNQHNVAIPFKSGQWFPLKKMKKKDQFKNMSQSLLNQVNDFHTKMAHLKIW